MNKYTFNTFVKVTEQTSVLAETYDEAEEIFDAFYYGEDTELEVNGETVRGDADHSDTQFDSVKEVSDD